MLYRAALKYYGLSEVPGNESNPLIVQWIVSALSWFRGDDSQMAWCGIFMGQILKEAGCSEYVPDKFWRARNWEGVGRSVSIHEAAKGDIVVFWRKHIDSGLGHVGIFAENSDKHISVLGGNQGNSVKFSLYPKSRLIGIYRIEKEVVINSKNQYSIITKWLLSKI